MSDLTELKDGWGEPGPPSPAARAAARAALMREITAAQALETAPRRRRGRLGWLMSGTAAAAAAAVLVVVLSPVQPGQPGQPTSPGQQAAPPSPAPGELSGRQILLRAAGVAQGQPESAGAYWHVEQEIHEPDLPIPIQRRHEWTTRDGRHYTMSEGDPGAMQIILSTGFFVGGADLTLARVQGLPTGPDKLTTWMTDSYSRLAPPQKVSQVPFGLSRLLWEVPAPPAVRAAALRALASLPNVTNLGTVDGGQALRIFSDPLPANKFPDGKLPPGTGEMTLVIDPGTATLVSFTTYQGTTRILAAGWTDDMPKIVPAN